MLFFGMHVIFFVNLCSNIQTFLSFFSFYLNSDLPEMPSSYTKMLERFFLCVLFIV